MLQAGVLEQPQTQMQADESPSPQEGQPETDSPADMETPGLSADSKQLGSQSQRSCIFEIEAILTLAGTKITPSVSQFLVCLLYNALLTQSWCASLNK